MPAYIIVEIEINDPVGYEEYKKRAGATVAQYGGKYIVRGGACETLEGDWKPKRIVVLQFENMERAKAWLNCPEYAEPAQNAPSHRPDPDDSGGRLVICNCGIAAISEQSGILEIQSRNTRGGVYGARA